MILNKIPEKQIQKNVEDSLSCESEIFPQAYELSLTSQVNQCRTKAKYI